MYKRVSLRIAFTLIVVLVLISIYALIPNTLSISGKVYAHALDQSLYTTLRNLKQTADKHPNPLPNTIQNASFKITAINYPHFNLHSFHQEGNGSLEIIPTQKIDSTIIAWEWNISTGYNPISRVSAFFHLQRLKDSISSFTKNLATYVSQTQNTYGLIIESTTITDTLIATVSTTFKSPPTTEMICTLMERLQQELQRAAIKNSSTIILSQRFEGEKYTVMAGVPVLERPSSASLLKMKKINPSKLLSGNVQGGPASIEIGYRNLRRYIMDRNIEEAGVSYEIPLTSRCTGNDTSTWQTKICYPVY
jgi:hypothetical protein